MRFPFFFLAPFLLCSVINASELDDQRPYEHFCSITGEVMKHPVVAADGYTYENQAIQQWFQQCQGRGIAPTSPKTNLPLAHTNLVENRSLETMITEWRHIPRDISSPLDTLDSRTIAELIQNEFEKHRALLHTSRDQHIVAFLGNTGAGKSTLVNLLAGKELHVTENDYVLANTQDPEAMPIGITGSSQTLYPKSIQVGNFLFFDLPGFNDTDGSIRNLVNAAFIRHILMNAASVRPVFVVGEDEFTTLRGDPVKKMFDSMQRLFVTDTEGILNNSIFVLTKSLCRTEQSTTNYLLQRTDAENKRVLQGQLNYWAQNNQIFHMYHPLLLALNFQNMRTSTLDRIEHIQASQIFGLNVSVLYPPETKSPLNRMFFKVMQDVFDQDVNKNLSSPEEYDRNLLFYTTEDFWAQFDLKVNQENLHMHLLKDFCIDPYREARSRFERENDSRQQDHIRNLKIQRQRLFSEVMQEIFDQNINKPLRTLSDYDEAISTYTVLNFWERFDQTVRRQDHVVSSLTALEVQRDRGCMDPYLEAIRNFERDYEQTRQEHLQSLRDRTQERIENIEDRTNQKAYQVTQSIMIGQEALLFDFAYHKDFYQQVCSDEVIGALAQDPKEQEVVRRYYAGWIGRHSHGQMMRWYAESIAPQIQLLTNRLERLERREIEDRVERPIERIIPEIARGYEAVYERFINGRLIYKPNPANDEGRLEFSIGDLLNPLESTFDLSRCGNASQYLSISTGYRRARNAANSNKVEVWIVPKFVAEREQANAQHLQPIMAAWTAPIALFYTWGNWSDLGWYDYLVGEQPEVISTRTLYENWQISPTTETHLYTPHHTQRIEFLRSILIKF